MKRSVRTILLVIIVTAIVTSIVLNLHFARFASPDVSNLAGEPVHIGNDPIVYFIYKLFFR